MTQKQKRVAHFLLHDYLYNSPPNDAMCRVYKELGYKVDFYTADNKVITNEEITIHPINYGFKWMLRHMFSLKWLQYDAFSCTTEDPIVAAGTLGTLYRKPIIVLGDEIRSGAYYGDRPERFKKWCRWAARRAKLVIVNDAARIELQRTYAGLRDNQPVIVYPGCFLHPPERIDSKALRTQWRVKSDDFIISHSGSFSPDRGAEWVFDCLGEDPSYQLLMHPLGIDSLTRYFIANHRYGNQVVSLPDKRLSWREAWQSMSGVDCGLVIYLDKGPQFQLMGTSSNRLCMFLAMGVPVIASWQPSFEFIERYHCGVLIRSGDELLPALKTVRANLTTMKANALTCYRQYIATADKYQTLKTSMEKALGT